MRHPNCTHPPCVFHLPNAPGPDEIQAANAAYDFAMTHNRPIMAPPGFAIIVIECSWCADPRTRRITPAMVDAATGVLTDADPNVKHLAPAVVHDALIAANLATDPAIPEEA